MITRSTVLVLGAGASEPYGMPTGFALTQSIVNELRDPSSSLRKQLLSVDEIRPDDVNDFAAQLAASDVSSVDTFLSHQEYFMRVGKAAIAAVLMRCEDPRRVTRFPEEGVLRCEDHWLGFLSQKLLANSSRQTFDENQLTIVTFNYDRLVEYYLNRSIQHTFGIEPDPATELRQNAVEIIHVHGVLSGRSVLGRGEASAEELNASIDTIKVLPESNKGDVDFTQARDRLSNAEAVGFLGFGYNPDNLERLNIKNTTKSKNVFGTTKGLLQGEIESAGKSMFKRLDNDDQGNGWFFYPEPKIGCLDFLRTYDFLQ